MYIEQQAADWLRKLINDRRFSHSIQNRSFADDIIRVLQDENTIPGFSIDVISRHRAAIAATHVLSLCSSLEIVSVNTSISKTKGEVLRPDIVAYNPEKQALVVFEIKRKQVSEREAVTEIVGYEQEIRNQFPFASELDIGFVLVSEEWSPLLTHSVSSLVSWHQKNFLCLTIDCVDSENFSLSLHLPEAWQMLGSVGLPASALQSIEIRPVDESVQASPPVASIITATQLIARKGDQVNSHGFVVAWSSSSSLSDVSWFITVCVLNPRELFYKPNPYLPEVRRSEFRNYFEKSEKTLTEKHSLEISRFALINDALTFLDDYQEIEISDARPWHDSLEFHKINAVPRFFDFWGVLGEYARSFICHSGVRERFMPYIKRLAFDWHEPFVAIPLIDDLSGKRPLPNGYINCSDAFEVGFCLGNLLVAYRNRQEDEKDEESLLYAIIWWGEVTLTQLSIEIAYIYNNAESLHVPPPGLRLQSMDGASVMEFHDWIEEYLITDAHPIHSTCFQLGAQFSELFNCPSSMFSKPGNDQHTLDCAASKIKEILNAIIERSIAAIDNNWISAESKAELLKLQTSFMSHADTEHQSFASILDSFPSETLCAQYVKRILPAADSIIEPIRFDTLGAFPVKVDWARLKMGVQLIYESGYKWPAVKVGANGFVGTGPINPEATHALAPLSDLENEVYLEVEFGLYPTITRTTWNELKNMELFQGT